jgi:hypothetical protein
LPRLFSFDISSTIREASSRNISAEQNLNLYNRTVRSKTDTAHLKLQETQTF